MKNDSLKNLKIDLTEIGNSANQSSTNLQKKLDTLKIDHTTKVEKPLSILSSYNKNEKFRLDYSGTANFKNKKPEYIIYNQNLFNFWDVIMENSTDENNNSFKISGFYEDNIFCWIDWTFEFESIEISWKNHVLHKDWLNGHLVIEK